MTNPQNLNQQQPPFDPDYDQVPPAQQPAEQIAVDGQQAAAGQPEPQRLPSAGGGNLPRGTQRGHALCDYA